MTANGERLSDIIPESVMMTWLESARDWQVIRWVEKASKPLGDHLPLREAVERWPIFRRQVWDYLPPQVKSSICRAYIIEHRLLTDIIDERVTMDDLRIMMQCGLISEEDFIDAARLKGAKE